MTTPCYIGREPECGCITFITVDKPEYAKETAKELARLVRDGCAVERIALADGSPAPIAHCPHWTWKSARAKRARTEVAIDAAVSA